MAKTFNKGKTASSDKKDSPKSSDKLIDELAGLEPLAYEQWKKTAAAELGIGVPALDTLVKAKRKAVRRAKAAPAAMPDLAASATPDQKAAASALMREADILEALSKVVESSGLVGEADNAKILYLALTSRLFERPVSIAIKGVSAGGKSYTVETVLKFFPNAAFFARTARTGMSEKALIYSEESFKHRFIIIYEAAGMNSDMMSYIIRTLLSEGRIDYEFVDKTASDGLLPKHIVKEGPIGLITTTTQAKLHPENETRLLSLSVVDTKEQTKAVMKSLAADRADLVDYVPWHLLQMRLAEGERRVEVPFAGQLADLIPPVAVRLRRDFKLLLTLVRAHALLHRETRGRDAQGRIIATVTDYGVVKSLVLKLFSEGVGATVSDAIRETVEAVEGVGKEVSITTLAKLLNLDKSAVTHRVRKAIERGFLVNREEKKGLPARIQVLDPLPEAQEILPDPARLEGCCSVEVEIGGEDEKVRKTGSGAHNTHMGPHPPENDFNTSTLTDLPESCRRTAPRSNGGAAPGLPEREIQGLAHWYVDQAADRAHEGDGVELDHEKLNAGLREALRERCLPEHVETEFTRVMAAVFRVV
jgi:predicted DNA-binding transcriptional regulator